MSAYLSIKSHGDSFLMFKTLKEDIQTIFAKGPTTENILEVALCCLGLYTIWLH